VLRIDHVVYAVRDLDRAAERFRSGFGLDSVAGGRHAAWGTANRIVPLGTQYIELISVVDPAEARGSEFGRTMLAFLVHGDRPFAVCAETDDLDAIAARLDLEISDGSRTRPDGRLIAWRGAGLDAAQRDRSMPFFIEWHLPSRDLHPARTPADHGVQATGIAWVEVAGNPEVVSDWLGGADLPIRVVDGETGVRACGVATTTGELVIR
jgi:catechol 2,3-dioxygenase-like lactoylglutathione lyase family enzyme